MALQKINNISSPEEINSIAYADIAKLGGIDVVHAGGIDLTTFTEDGAGITVVDSDKVEVASMARSASAGLYKDMGAGYVSGDFEFQWYFYITSGASTSVVIYFALSEAFYLTRADRDTANDGLETFFQVGTGIGLTDFKSPSSDLISIVSGPPFGWWVTLTRVGTLVTYNIYTDSGRTSLAGTNTLTQSSAYSYRYLYAISSLDTTGAAVQTGYIRDIVKI